MKLFYLYEIKIENIQSSLNGCFYYGKHEIDSDKKDNYYGSGKIIKSYCAKHGLVGLTKTILEYYYDSDTLCKAEKELVAQKMQLLGNKCLNIAEGGSGS